MCLFVVGLAVVHTSQQAGADSAAGVIRPGQASADASVFSVVVQSGGTTLKPSAVGRASAAYVEAQTQASSATVDLGGVGYLLTAIPICGQVLLPDSRQPQPLAASSADGASSRTTGGNVGGAGTQSVSVSPAPEYATATTKPFTQSLLGGLLQIGGTATSTVRYVDQSEQQADSSVTANLSLAHGVVVMDGMHWEASQHAGRTTTQSASFTFGTVTVANLGMPMTLPSGTPAGAVVSAINAAVGPFGMHVTLPANASDPTSGTTAIGPLQVHFAGSSLDNKFLTPAANQLAELEALYSGQTANGTDCSDFKNLLGNLANPGDTVANVVVGIMEGAGGVDLGLGGASASTQPATDYANPLAGGGSTGASGLVITPSQTVPTAAPSVTDVGAAPATAPVSTSDSPSPAAITATRTSAGFLRCVTTSPAGRPGCWSGLGAAAGGVTTAAAAALLAADIAFSRRTRRRRRTRAAA